MALDNVHRLASPVIGGFHEYGRGIEMRRRLGPGFSWILTFDSIAFQFIRRLRADSALVAQEIELGSWTEDHIGELLQERAEAVAIEPSFDNLVLPRQLDEASYEVEGDRKRHGFNRIIWDSSLGNPGVALRMWCESLTVTDDGKVDVRLGSKRTRSSLDTLSLTSQFVLRSIAQMEYARQEDVVKALNLPPAEVDMALQAAKANGLIEEQDGLFSISWPWYREITRFLNRRNLLASS